MRQQDGYVKETREGQVLEVAGGCSVYMVRLATAFRGYQGGSLEWHHVQRLLRCGTNRGRILERYGMLCSLPGLGMGWVGAVIQWMTVQQDRKRSRLDLYDCVCPILRRPCMYSGQISRNSVR